ncbi:MAG TPA: class E sortase [Actinomycetota bacterium]|nr:class E sortase [Actinomycetota bacterium]
MVLRWFGRGLIAAGSLIILFIIYELYGTGFITAHHQAQLKHDFLAKVAQAQHAPATPTPTVSTAPSPSAAAATSTATTAPPAELKQGPIPASQAVALLEIPKIGLSIIVVQGVSVADLKLGPGHYPGTPLPGQPGNVVISGHRTTYLHPFRNVDRLSAGDPIYLTTPDGKKYTYLVTKEEAVLPTDVAVVDDTPTNQLTLTTCTPPFSASHRLIVIASLQGEPASVT